MIKKIFSIFHTLGVWNAFKLITYKEVLKLPNLSFLSKLKIQRKKHNIILNFIEQKLAIAKRYDFYPQDPNMVYCEKTRCEITPNTIWFFWWQGEEGMPPIVRRCYERAKEKTANWNLILLTKGNLSNYLKIPECVLKLGGGKKSFTHLSDYVRLNLLAEYGGLWLDSTFYLSEQLPSIESFGEFYTVKNHAKDNICVAEYRWFVSLLYIKAGSSYIKHIRNMFCYNWMHYDYIVDYLLMDYLFEYEQMHNAHFCNLLDQLAYNNPDVITLSRIINNAFSGTKWKQIKKKTFCYKTTYKVAHKTEVDGKPTYYKKLINGEI